MKSKFNPFHRPARLLAALALTLATIPAYATSYYWDGTDSTANADGGNGTWNTVLTNWDDAATGGNATAWVNDNQAVFAAPGGTVTLGANITTIGSGTIGGLHFATGNYIIDTNGYNLTVKQGSDRAIRVGNGTTATIQGSGSVVLGNNLIFQPDTTGSLIVSCKITGNFSLSKWSSGALTLSNNANDFKGKLYTQNGGSVSVSSIKDSGVASAAGAGSLIEFGAGAANAYIYTGSGDSTNRTLSLSAPGVNPALRSNGTGALVWTGSFQNNISTARTFILGGNNTGNNEMQAAMADNGGNVLSITKADAGRWILSGNNTYTGETNINAGTLRIGSTGAINNTAGITVLASATLEYVNTTTGLTRNVTLSGGTFRNNGAAFTGALTGNGIITGSGSINVAVALDSLSDILRPGNSPGIQGYGASQSWDSFTYEWEVNDFTDLTAGSGFDQITIAGTLALTGGTGDYALDILPLTLANIAGSLANFDNSLTRSWTILTASGGITGFDAANWNLNTSQFATYNSFNGTWSLAQSGGNDLVLTYTAIPEPSTWVLFALGIGGIVLLRRQPRNREKA